MSSLTSLVALALCIQFFQVQLVFGQSQTCSFELEEGTDIAPENRYNLPSIQDIAEPGKELLVVKAINTVSIVPPDTRTNRVYIEAALSGDGEEKTLVLKLTDSFVDYEEHETETTTSIFVEFTCTDGTRKIEFIQPIEDTNNHDPEFEDAPYKYNLPMPLPKNLALDKFVPISARDIDLTNTKITFTLESEPSGFSVEWSSRDTDDIKLHYATLLTTAIVSLTEDSTFNLHATDNGTPTRTTTTTVTIEVDQANSILRFAQSLYIANLTSLEPEEANGMIVPFDKIGLVSGAVSTVEYSIHDELSDYDKSFQLVPAADRSSVELKLVDPPESFFTEDSVVLSLGATKAGATEKTVLHIILPGMNRSISTPPPETGAVEEKEEVEEEDNFRTATIVLGLLFAVSVIGNAGCGYLYLRYWKK